MVRVSCALVSRHVASRAGCIRQVIVAVDVAGGARHAHMSSGQRKTCNAMVECRHLPRRGVVAGLAGGGHVRLHVIWIRRSLVVLEMASHTVRWGSGELPIQVTCVAGHSDVRAGQREAGRGVIELSVQP